jgi:hypothetical protein
VRLGRTGFLALLQEERAFYMDRASSFSYTTALDLATA